MDIQNHSDQNVNEISDEELADLLIADPQKSYPIRLLHLSNGSLIVGYVLTIFPDCVHLMQPHIIQPFGDRNQEGEWNIEMYDLVPYLNQLVEYNPSGLEPTPFMLSSVITINVPAEHLRRNFNTITQMKQFYSENEESIRGEFPSKGTLH